MTSGRSVERDSAGAKVARAIGHGLWILLPILSLGILAWLPATQTWWRARSAGWAITAAALVLASAGVAAGFATDAAGAGMGFLLIGTTVAGVVAAALGRSVLFGRRTVVATTPDPAIQAVLNRRERRSQAREIAARDPAMAIELRIGRPDLPQRSYDDGDLVDLNNTTADGLVAALGWDRAVVDPYVSGRDLRGGYTSLDEIAALSELPLTLLEHDAERILVLPHRPA